MALDLANLTIADTTLDTTERSAGRKARPNPFVDNGWLAASYNSAKAIKVKGSDVAELVNAIRNAANRITDESGNVRYGVSIQIVDNSGERLDSTEWLRYWRDVAKVCNGEEVEGIDSKKAKADGRLSITVKYMAKDRRQRKNGDAVE